MSGLLAGSGITATSASSAFALITVSAPLVSIVLARGGYGSGFTLLDVVTLLDVSVLGSVAPMGLFDIPVHQMNGKTNIHRHGGCWDSTFAVELVSKRAERSGPDEPPLV